MLTIYLFIYLFIVGNGPVRLPFPPTLIIDGKSMNARIHHVAVNYKLHNIKPESLPCRAGSTNCIKGLFWTGLMDLDNLEACALRSDVIDENILHCLQ
jgi:hypothetical protein